MESSENPRNGHSHTFEDKVLNNIDRTARRLSSQVESVYERVDQIEARVLSLKDQAQNFIENATSSLHEHPVRVIAGSFVAGLLVGAWLTRRD